MPETHDRHNGMLVSVASVNREIQSKRAEHDGVTILGGEPFDQAGPVAELVSRLKRFDLNLAIYSGKTLEDLIARHDPCVDYILAHIDLLIDGPFEKSLTSGAGEYRGSSNQRFHGQAGSS
ncbi:MAG: 4Fe-4S cluster-binding domain-containing protein [Chloracidobacterium sp.]|nr:4Fe-4S cluster-binding domain-containing protein [Chloracidobacterium sp.]MBL0239497.1 4Fe-4S cluster-binding domain-containing protein [Chloracidobacterium sp.]